MGSKEEYVIECEWEWQGAEGGEDGGKEEGAPVGFYINMIL